MLNFLGESAITNRNVKGQYFNFLHFRSYREQYKLNPAYIKPSNDLQTLSTTTLKIFLLFVSIVNMELTQSNKFNIIRNHKIPNNKIYAFF